VKELRVKIKTLTPLWTGGVDGTMDRIHETGILGSLRWWYEALVRGLGGEACDPTSDGKSGTSKRCPDDNGHYCDVCAVFGATGLRRAFRLEGPAWWNAEHHNRLTVKVNQHRRHRGWYLGRGYLGEGELALRALRLPENWQTDDLWQTLYLALRLISCWAGIGAKSQQGYGVVQTEADKFALDIDRAFGVVEDLKNRSNRRGISPPNGWPAIDKFFFAKVQFGIPNGTDLKQWIRGRASQITPEDELEWYLNPNNDSARDKVLPIASIVRYHLRGLIRTSSVSSARHRLMGELGCKSLVHVSHAYPVNDGQWEFRIWGWIPNHLSGVNRAIVLDNLQQWIGIQQSQERQWHDSATDQNTLWNKIGLNEVQVRWFSKQSDENTVDFLKALLTNCDTEPTRGSASAGGSAR